MIKNTLTAALGLALLAGCTSKVAEWTPAEAPKKNIVERSMAEHVVRYPAHWSHIPKDEEHRLRAFMSNQMRYPDAVHVYLTEFGGHGEKRIQDIVKMLRKSGVRQGSVTVDEYQDTHLGHTGSGVVMMVERFLVIPPACQDWTREMGSAEGDLPMSNFGCSDAINFGMMVADPRDLVTGKDVGPYDGTRQALSIQMYREGEVKELLTEETSSVGGGGESGG